MAYFCLLSMSLGIVVSNLALDSVEVTFYCFDSDVHPVVFGLPLGDTILSEGFHVFRVHARVNHEVDKSSTCKSQDTNSAAFGYVCVFLNLKIK